MGPGQLLVRRERGLGFTHDMSSVLAAGAAALNHRVEALFQIDGLYDFANTPIAKAAADILNDLNDIESVSAACSSLEIPTGLRWMMLHGFWSFKVQARAKFLKEVNNFTLRSLGDKIERPVFVGDPEQDIFFKGSPRRRKRLSMTRPRLLPCWTRMLWTCTAIVVR
ncbi:hypothetical protein F5Y19DRAFT_477156 [Xylariaceae sp. FL1651]|nr:hypothetical protein F5Y19DRAFT_477156 [Xylariaceae sp. FL1651]